MARCFCDIRRHLGAKQFALGLLRGLGGGGGAAGRQAVRGRGRQARHVGEGVRVGLGEGRPDVGEGRAGGEGGEVGRRGGGYGDEREGVHC